MVRRMILAATALCAACAPAPLPEPVPLAAPCTVTDGDTIRCGEERIRLLAIDAPEKPGACREGRACAPGDPVASTESLRVAVAQGGLTVRRVGKDRYGRTLALVSAGGIDLSCHQLEQRQAIYVRRWDDSRAVARTCPAVVSASE